ncbi:hypothetical protein BH24ACT15_BH24ACT15_17190 [soil metagenome]
MSWDLPEALDDEQLRRPFDHYARYRLAAEVVMLTVGPQARVLDLGGGPGSLQAFRPDADVTATDIAAPSKWHEQAPSLILADGAQLPFAADAFDVVVSLDTLEHVPPASRTSFTNEAARVAARWALVVCPYNTPGVADADIALREYVKNRFAADLPTIQILNEHLDYGHPDLATTREQMAAAGPVATIPSGRLDRWLAGMLAFFHLLALGDDEPVEVMQRFINRNLYAADLADPAYRHGLLVRTGTDDVHPDQVAAQLTARAATDPWADADLDLLRITLGETLVASATNANERADQAARALVAAEAQLQRSVTAAEDSRDLAEKLQAAHQADLDALQALQASHDELAAFRDQVLGHPVMRVRRMAQRLLGRG